MLPAQEVPSRLALAARLGVQSVPIRSLWHGALVRSLQSSVAVNDTLFIELADCERPTLATFDRKLIQAFPALAMRPREI